MENQDTIGVQEMAQRLGVTTQTIYNYLERGVIKNTRVRRGMGYRRIVLRADFEAAAAQLLEDMPGDGTIDDESQVPGLAADLVLAPG